MPNAIHAIFDRTPGDSIATESICTTTYTTRQAAATAWRASEAERLETEYGDTPSLAEDWAEARAEADEAMAALLHGYEYYFEDGTDREVAILAIPLPTA